MSTWLGKLIPKERRGAERGKPYELVVHYWNGAAPAGHKARDISSSGIFLLTDDRWYPGTQVMLSLQRAGASMSDPDRAIMVKGQVVRSDRDGVALALLATAASASHEVRDTFSSGVDEKTIRRFMKKLTADAYQAQFDPGGSIFSATRDAFLSPDDRRAILRIFKKLRSDGGQALVEYILMLPLIFILIVNLINFAGFFFAWITVSNAARTGADYMALGGASAGAPGSATAAQIQSAITADLASLPNNPSAVINLCINNSGTVTAKLGTCTSVPADPEPSSYNLVSVDVTYTYKPYIPASFKFANLNLYVSIPPTTIHRRAVVRSMY
ncbi:MAG: pilus assembly protein [Acidobacteria bacterium]|nr:pilus assembly protein [Acidobacteriota bacterium]